MTSLAAQPEPEPEVPRLALTKKEAATTLGVSIEFFERHIMGDLRVIHRGRRWLIPLSELQRWLNSTAERTVEQ